MENLKESVSAEPQKQEKKRKKKGKVAQVYTLHKKGVSVKEITEKMKLSERVVRSYIDRYESLFPYKPQ